MTERPVDREVALDELLTKQEIRDVMARYCRGVNRLDIDLVRSCFHPDAWEDHGAFHGEASAFCDGLRAGLESFTLTFHFVGNSLIEIEGDSASHETYFIAYDRLPADESGVEKDVIFGGRYLAVHERRNGGPWLIAERTVVHDWHRVDPVGEVWPYAASFAQAAQGHEDLAYRLLDPNRKRGSR
jgi:hypothetical protein